MLAAKHIRTHLVMWTLDGCCEFLVDVMPYGALWRRECKLQAQRHAGRVVCVFGGGVPTALHLQASCCSDCSGGNGNQSGCAPRFSSPLGRDGVRVRRQLVANEESRAEADEGAAGQGQGVCGAAAEVGRGETHASGERACAASTPHPLPLTSSVPLPPLVAQQSCHSTIDGAPAAGEATDQAAADVAIGEDLLGTEGGLPTEVARVLLVRVEEVAERGVGGLA